MDSLFGKIKRLARREIRTNEKKGLNKEKGQIKRRARRKVRLDER
jgi:hypothetical protein